MGVLGVFCVQELETASLQIMCAICIPYAKLNRAGHCRLKRFRVVA